MSIKIRLVPDAWHLKDVGRLDNDALYRIDVQFSSEGNDTRDFVVTYVFDLDGNLIWYEIEDLGLRSNSRQQGLSTILSQHREKLGGKLIADIRVRPFSVNSHGLVFGLVVRNSQVENGSLQFDHDTVVDAMPGWT